MTNDSPDLEQILKELTGKSDELKVILKEMKSNNRQRGMGYIHADVDRIIAEMRVLQEKANAIVKSYL